MAIAPNDVLTSLSKSILVDGYDLVIDLDKSHGSWLVDSRSGKQYLDLFSFFASLPLGMNHPKMCNDQKFLENLTRAALHKVSNPDVYTVEYAHFVDTFRRILGDPELPHLFFIDGGALAVENALKVAFDWKARRSGRGGNPREKNYRVLHLADAFHGRSGYTLSVTNTDPSKTSLFPRWSWPKISAPAQKFPEADHLTEVANAEKEALHSARSILEEAGDDIACFLAEPIQGEGGDRHMRAEFLQAIERLCHEFDILFVLDEVQTGCGMTGTPWAYQQLGLQPDLVAFGKKTQVCGLMGGRRVDLVPENAFRVSSRISSTWGGNLADMVRATRIFEIIDDESLIAQATIKGAHLLSILTDVAEKYPQLVSNVRGRGLICAFDLPDSATRDVVITRLREEEGILILPSGKRSIRFRPALTILMSELDAAAMAMRRVLGTLDLPNRDNS